MLRPSHVRPLAFALVVSMFLGLVPLATPALAAEPAVPTLAGVWQTSDGAYFRITQETGGTAIDSYMGPDDPCSGGPRDYVIKGTLDGEALTGTVQRCDDLDHPLVVNCGLEPLWETTFTANVSALEIAGEYVGEYYEYDYDSGGNITGCTLTDNPINDLSFYRVDCWVLSFEELAEEYMEVEADRPEAVEIAEQFEAGARLFWTEGQRAPGGLKEQVDRFAADLRNRSYTVSINSAYRPLLYQAHFADMRHCALELLLLVTEHPEVADLVAPTALQLVQEMNSHRLKHQPYNASGLTFPVPFVCKNLPLTNCPHVNERAADMSISPDNRTIDFIGALYGLCRPYVHASTPDKPHWDTVGPNPYGVAKCHELATGHSHGSVNVQGNSPVDLLLADSAGMRVGFDPDSGEAVNDFGPEGASYSGPGTEPQVIQIHSGSLLVGAYTVTGVGTGAGSYSITAEVVSEYGNTLSQASVQGQAMAGEPIEGLSVDVAADYAPPSAILQTTRTAGPGGSTHYTVDKGTGAQTVAVSGGGITDLVVGADVDAIGMTTDGSGGTATVEVPSALIGGDLTVHADGVVLTASRTATASGASVTFDVPPGTFLVTLGGSAPAAGAPSPAGGGDFPWMLVVGGAAAAGAAAAAVIVWRRRQLQ
ncbi:MAG TPA: hypothetical protein VGB42_08825 [Candidatus Thermoplasmatota archaeon]